MKTKEKNMDLRKNKNKSLYNGLILNYYCSAKVNNNGENYNNYNFYNIL